MTRSVIPRPTRTVALCSVLTVVGSGLLASAAPPQITGSLDTVQGVRVLKLWGTPAQRGYAHGYLLGADLMEFCEDAVLDERIVDQPGDYEAKVRGGLMRRFRFGPDYRAELEGMLRGITEAVGVEGTRFKTLARNLDVQDLMAINALADWYPFACSSFSAWGEATDDGQMITGRNLDFAALPGLDTKHVLIAYLEPGPGRQPWVSLAWPGLIGAYTAMNADGVTISMHDAKPLEPTHQGAFVPRAIALREAIENARAATAVADVKRVLIKSPAMMGNNIHVSSPFKGQRDPAAVFEYDGNLPRDGGVTQRVSNARPLPCWLTCTNHYCLRREPPPIGDHPFDTVTRFNKVSEALAAALKTGGKIDLPLARRVMSDVATQGNGLTVHTVYYLPNHKEMHVSLARPGVAAPATAPVRLRLAELLRK
ncbi:MAG: C45 family autoproteolytic acyltransferase/hydrolase [Planctomycetota bacterium]